MTPVTTAQDEEKLAHFITAVDSMILVENKKHPKSVTYL